MLKWSLLAVVVVVIALFLKDTSSERSLTLQIFKYFCRPHAAVPSGPIRSSAAWYGPHMLANKDKWQIKLNAEEIDALHRAVSIAASTNKTLKQLTASDFPLGILAANITIWKKALDPEFGMGILVIRGLPVNKMTKRERELLFWGIGLHMGVPGAQNGHGDLLGRVSNEFFGVDNESYLGNVRQYRTSEEIAFHCDPADVVGLLCLDTAGGGGGRSRIASSVTIFNEIYKKFPDMVPLLFNTLALDTRGDGGHDWLSITPCAYSNGVLRTFWHTEYFRTAYRYPDSPYPSIPLDISGLINTYDSIANDPDIYLEMEFQIGDLQLISNHVVVHSRTKFHDTVDRKRDLLRLWLSLPLWAEGPSPNWQQFSDILRSGRSGVVFAFDLAKSKVNKMMKGY